LSSEAALRAGDWVEVRSAAEILATLDERGGLDALPFMPEMLQYCGKRFQVYKSAHKTCDTSQNLGTLRELPRTVHLAGLRCDGSAHGGCQAACLLFWKEAWLKPVNGSEAPHRNGSKCDLDRLTRATRRNGSDDPAVEPEYRCQITELNAASTPLPWWQPRSYVRDLLSRNVRLFDFIRFILLAAYNSIMRLHWRGRPYPYVRGTAGKETPSVTLNLQPGELVRVRSREEIMRTLNVHDRNRGLSFDPEMVPYCGKTVRVLRRVERIVNERTGRMTKIPGVCLMLEDVICGGCLSSRRLFCPRAIYSYWHEIWLERVAEQ